MKCAPVLLIGFNRPDFMSAQIDAIRLVAPSRLYLAVDGPREDCPDEVEQCRKVRDCVNLIDWPCEVKTLFHEKNIGCKYGVSGAITWFFENEEEGIVLEDDCRPSPDFFRFATDLLERYRNDERVGAINGFNFFNLQSNASESYHFSRHMDVWGWASWRRVWKDYDVEMSAFQGRESQIIGSSYMTTYAKNVLSSFVRGVKDGSLLTWDVQFTMLFLDRGYLSIVPKVRLIANAGMSDGRATHTGSYVYWQKYWGRTGELGFPMIHARDVACDTDADRVRERMEGAIFPRGLTWLGAKFPCLCGSFSAIGATTEKFVPFLFKI